MPSGSFFRSSLSCAPVAAGTLIVTSLTGVAGPMPQCSSFPIKLSGEVAGLFSGVWLMVRPPPKMPPAGGEGEGVKMAGGSAAPKFSGGLVTALRLPTGYRRTERLSAVIQAWRQRLREQRKAEARKLRRAAVL